MQSHSNLCSRTSSAIVEHYQYDGLEDLYDVVLDSQWGSAMELFDKANAILVEMDVAAGVNLVKRDGDNAEFRFMFGHLENAIKFKLLMS